ncbi:MAG: SpoIIE family protein phosphatase [Spirochaetes bacterium]|nr:SpoIIE family protein phosphatase [Spirochaetota bacterium]
MVKLKIKAKILLVLLSLTLVSLLLISGIMLYHMKKLGEYSLGGIVRLGEHAADDSTNALEGRAQEYLLRLAGDQAAISNTLFEKVAHEASIMSDFAASIWADSSRGDLGRNYSTKERPDDILSASVYVLAPDVSLSKIRNEIDRTAVMDRIFMPVLANDSNLSSVYLGTESGITRIYPWISKIDDSYDSRKRSWYIEAVRSGKLGWTKLYVDAFGHGLCVTCYTPVFDRNGTVRGAIGADVTLEALNERIINTQVGSLGYAFLIDGTGRVIARPGLDAADTRWDTSFETENLLKSRNKALVRITEEMVGGFTGVSRCMFDGGEKFIAYAPVSSTGWSLGLAIPRDEIVEPVRMTRDRIIDAAEEANLEIVERIRTQLRILAVLITGIILSITLLAIRLSNTITNPIRALSEGAKTVGGGDLDHRLLIRTGDEIEHLADTFNKMAGDLKIHIKRLKETTAQKERIESELEIAREIQSSALPGTFPPFPDRNEFDIFAMMDPAQEVGGDFFDFFLVDDERLCFLLGDVSGKGVPAALFMMITKTLLKNEALQGAAPDEILYKVNTIVGMDNETNMFATVFCAILNSKTGEVDFSNAGHNPPFLCKTGNGAELLEVDKNLVLGIMEETAYSVQKITLKPNDMLFMYTDGITEAMNPKKDLFSEQRLQAILSDAEGETVTGIIRKIRKEISTFTRGEPQSDDITMVALRYFGPPVSVA